MYSDDEGNKSKKVFTLVELLDVIVITGILMMVVIAVAVILIMHLVFTQLLELRNCKYRQYIA